MKLFKILILLIIAPFLLDAQIPGPVTGSPSNRGEVRTFGTRIDVLGITAVTDSTHLIDIRVSDYGRRGYTADSIAVNQYLRDQECSRYLIDSVGTVSGSNNELVTVRVLELLGVTTAPIRGPGAVMEEDIYPKIIPGLPQQMQFCIDDFFKDNLSDDVISNNRYWDSGFDYDSLATAIYLGDQYKAIGNPAIGERPDTSSNWSVITTVSPASIADTYLYKDDIITNNTSISADTISTYGKYNVIVKNDTISKLTRIGIPVPSASLSNRTFTVVDSSKFFARTYLESDGDLILKYGDQFTDKYYLDRGEVVNITYTDSTAIIQPISRPKPILNTIDFLNGLFFEGQEIAYKNGKYKLQKSLPDYGLDSLFVVAVTEKAPYGENLLKNSNQITHGVGVGKWNLSDAIRPSLQNVALSIDGTKTADALYIDQTGAARFIQLSDKILYPGDKVTYSFWYKAADAQSNNNIYFDRMILSSSTFGIDLNPYIIRPDTINKKWEKFEYTFDITDTVSVDWGVFLYLEGDVGDTLYVDRFQMERTPSASLYKPTTTNIAEASDTSYAVYQPYDDVLRLSQLYRGTIESDAEFLQKAINYASSFSPRKNVMVDMDLTIDEVYYNDSICIAMPENMSLVGPTKANDQKYTITFDVSDTTAFGIYYLNDLDVGVGYNTNQNIRNLSFSANSGLKTFIDRGATSTSFITDCYFNGQDSVLVGIQTGRIGPRGALFSYIVNSNIQACKYNIWYEQCGSEHYILGGVSSRAVEAAVYTDTLVTEVLIRDFDSEDNNNYIFYINGVTKKFECDECYFETSKFYFSNSANIMFKNGRMSGSSDIFTFGNGINSFTAENMSFNTCLPLLPDKVRGIFINNEWSRVNLLRSFDNYYQGNKYVYRYGNKYDVDDSSEWQSTRNESNYTDIHSGWVDGTFTGNLSDTIYTDNTFLKGGAENLLTYSDSLGVTGSFTRNNIIGDTLIHPVTGETTVDIIKSNLDYTSPPGTLRSFTLPITPIIGEPYVFSVLAKKVSDAGVGTSFGVTIGGVDYNKSLYIHGTDWKRYYVLIDSVESTSTSFSFSVDSGVLGDSIAITDLSLTRGAELRSIVRTGATAIYDQGAKFTIQDTDNNLDIEGGMILSTATNPYGGSNEIGAIFDSIGATKWVYETPAPGDTVQLSYNTFILPSGAGTIYLDDSNINSDAYVKVSSNGTITLSKVGAVGSEFQEYESAVANPTVTGMGITKSYVYLYNSGIYWLTDYQNISPLSGVTASTTRTVKLNDLISIDSDAAASVTTVGLDATSLPIGGKFEINIRDAEVYNCVLNADGNQLEFNGRQLTGDTIRFAGSSTYVLDCTHFGSGNIGCYNKTDYNTNTGFEYISDTTYTRGGASPDSLFVTGGDTVTLQIQDWVRLDTLHLPLSVDSYIVDSTIVVDEDGAGYQVRLNFDARTTTISSYIEILVEAPTLTGRPFIIDRTQTFPKGVNQWISKNISTNIFGGSITGEPLKIRLTSPDDFALAGMDLVIDKVRAAHGIHLTYAP